VCANIIERTDTNIIEGISLSLSVTGGKMIPTPAISKFGLHYCLRRGLDPGRVCIARRNPSFMNSLGRNLSTHFSVCTPRRLYGYMYICAAAFIGIIAIQCKHTGKVDALNINPLSQKSSTRYLHLSGALFQHSSLIIFLLCVERRKILIYSPGQYFLFMLIISSKEKSELKNNNNRAEKEDLRNKKAL